MKDPDGTTKEFASSFKRFIDAMNAEAAKETSPLLERLRAHLGGDPGRMPIVSEDYDNYEHPNVQAALDKVLYSEGRTADLAERDARAGHPAWAKLVEWGVPDRGRRDADRIARDASALKGGR